ncbi:sodium/calcium exchanger NCL2-like [Andrographis paniculata]|uniref:sodium/calcium exchanger NCL2-like n=1 Tax=Andrographis paniculata TaxID=175694 RepID=UPI0021E7824A|nr:sodium/calcium exchanger NCL2-like [Andrographis paniculata]
MSRSVLLLLVLVVVVVFFFFVPVAISRPLLYNGSGSWNPMIIADGRGDDPEVETTSSSGGCEEMYGFLPCATTAGGQLFLIVVYEYLLFHAESYLGAGGDRIFKILGPGVFGATAFQLIGSLPEALILLASGLWSSSEEGAQECVVTGLGLLAGSSTLLLTVVWGACVFLAARRPSPSPEPTRLERLFLRGCGGAVTVTVTDARTSYTARIMLLSGIPLAMIQIPGALSLSYRLRRAFLLLTLLFSLLLLLSYFFYQICEPWIQERRLLYIKHEHLVVDVLNHFQNRTMGNLLTDNGSPNIHTITRVFAERDSDGDRAITFSELKAFLEETTSTTTKLGKIQPGGDKDRTAAEIMKEFDRDSDDKITLDEFVEGMRKWIYESKDAMNKRYHSLKSLKDLYQVLKPWIQKKREEREMMRHLIPDIVDHLQHFAYGNLLTEDGSPDVAALKRLFKDIDLDNDDCISYEELKQLVSSIVIPPYDSDMAASRMMEELDVNKDRTINEDEFVSGLSRWLTAPHCHPNTASMIIDQEATEEENYQKTWEQTDRLVAHKLVDQSARAWAKAIGLLVVGVVMLGALAEPLVQSVRGLSKAARVPPFYIAFVLVPLATTARLAVSALKEARQKKLPTTSLTLSEIYGTVFMNNVLGMVVLLSLIYFRPGLEWEFSAEVLMVLAVSAVIGCVASFNRVFPVWASILACLMYPLSLLLLYFLAGGGADSNWLSGGHYSSLSS